MQYEIKEEYKHIKFDNMNYALKDLNQKQIEALPEIYKSTFFICNKPKTIKAKKNVDTKNEI